MISRTAVTAVALCATGVLAGSAQAGLTFHSPSPYTKLADSPWAAEGGTFFVEDFEDGALNSLGLTADAGTVRAPSLYTDSVDLDDGSLDGWGRDGYSFLTTAGAAGIMFSFDDAAIGGFPTIAGLVWTDGNWASMFTFEAFDASGASLGTMQHLLGDENDGTGQTAEDRFLGVEYDGGISAIRVWTEFGGIEVDHVQYGFAPVPTPGAIALLTVAGGLVSTRRRRRQ